MYLLHSNTMMNLVVILIIIIMIGFFLSFFINNPNSSIETFAQDEIQEITSILHDPEKGMIKFIQNSKHIPENEKEGIIQTIHKVDETITKIKLQDAPENINTDAITEIQKHIFSNDYSLKNVIMNSGKIPDSEKNKCRDFFAKIGAILQKIYMQKINASE